ncbi:putative adaptin N terminal region domain-containing protein [Neospora caninum Liverpool]|uniref:Adaptin N terminal region domain-containing protein, putative n=1 Tax=Neospora caninum (strain Liverpool) TaxID=572307 RepID=F0VBT7_NEOCL|nr:putative adaptin N terminal region domain-containing protein [Neospora caninum Liverpool]CBZ51071.1 putative adaptin N terminal region domain-containing protein [Neospora caninum Liverpool]CEL68378.1 TPA: adaptin N terminal region domain-containing protein, putative [Neospora caninum Liverpool]|eukprot:XP_003881104.1 putative adaptin N terminal region domain-containing protein [Neospora caninum Liverpool]
MSLAPLMASTGPLLDRASAGMRALISIVSKSECQYFEEGHFNAAQVKKELQDASVESKVTAMKRLLAAHAAGADVSALLPEVVKAIAVPDLELKRLVYLFLIQHAEGNRDLALLSINSFQKDLTDRNQIVRAAALKALASIRLLEVVQLLVVSLKRAAADCSPFVRRTAAQCVVKVFALDQDQFEDLKNIVLTLLADVEVSVVGAALVAFRELCLRHSHLLLHDDENHPDDRDQYLECTYTPTGEGGGLRATSPRTPDAIPGLEGEGPGKEAREIWGQAAALALLHRHYRRLQKCLLQLEPFAQVVAVDIFLRYCRLFFADPVEHFRRETPNVTGPSAKDLGRKNETESWSGADQRFGLSSEKARARTEDKSEGSGAAAAQVTIEKLTADSPGNPVPPDFRLFLSNLPLLLHSESPAVVVAATAALFSLLPSAPAAWQAAVHPLLRCLHTSAPDLQEPLLHTIAVLGSSAPSLFIPHVRSFFLRFSDSPAVRQAKLKVLRGLLASAASQDSAGDGASSLALLLLPEVTTYIHWPGDQALLPSSFRLLTFLALRFPGVQAACMQTFVRLLDAPSPALAAEAVLALQTLLQRQLEQQRERSARGGQLGHLLLQLVSQFPRVHAPPARASVVWIVGQYQREVGWVAADFLRQLVAKFKAEAEEVKLQILLLALKVWAFHWLNKRGLAHETPDDTFSGHAGEDESGSSQAAKGGEQSGDVRSDETGQSRGSVGDQRLEQIQPGSCDVRITAGSYRGMQTRDVVTDEIGPGRQPTESPRLLPMPTKEDSEEAFPRLDGMLKYICEVASFDRSYDVRDMARLYFTLSRLSLSTERPVAGQKGASESEWNTKREDLAPKQMQVEGARGSTSPEETGLSAYEGLSGLGGDTLKPGTPLGGMQQFASAYMRFLAAAPGARIQKGTGGRSVDLKSGFVSRAATVAAHLVLQNGDERDEERPVSPDVLEDSHSPVFVLGSLSDHVAERMIGYASLPPFADENSSDQLRHVETEERRALVIGPAGAAGRSSGGVSPQKELKSISSEDVVVRRNAAALMGREAVAKTALTPLDLDSFYSDLCGVPGTSVLTETGVASSQQQGWGEATGGRQTRAEREDTSGRTNLWQMFGNTADPGSHAEVGASEQMCRQGTHQTSRMGGVKSTGCGGGVAVAGEDDESEDEDREWRAATVGEKDLCDGSCGNDGSRGDDREDAGDWKFMPAAR